MPPEPKNILISSISIVVGGYYLPASVLFGAIVGASIFIMFKPASTALRKAVLFLIAFVCGLFAGHDAALIFNTLTPDGIRVGEFVGAALAAALSVTAIEALTRAIANFKFNFNKKDTI